METGGPRRNSHSATSAERGARTAAALVMRLKRHGSSTDNADANSGRGFIPKYGPPCPADIFYPLQNAHRSYKPRKDRRVEPEGSVHQHRGRHVRPAGFRAGLGQRPMIRLRTRTLTPSRRCVVDELRETNRLKVSAWCILAPPTCPPGARRSFGYVSSEGRRPPTRHQGGEKYRTTGGTCSGCAGEP